MVITEEPLVDNEAPPFQKQSSQRFWFTEPPPPLFLPVLAKMTKE